MIRRDLLADSGPPGCKLALCGEAKFLVAPLTVSLCADVWNLLVGGKGGKMGRLVLWNSMGEEFGTLALLLMVSMFQIAGVRKLFYYK